MTFDRLCIAAILVFYSVALATVIAAARTPEATSTETAAPANQSATPTPLPIDGPLSPPQASSSFTLEPGLRIELVASEPLVDSPVAIAFDKRGRMFVAENRGYPNGPPKGEPPVGRIAMLEDGDGDGYFEKRTTFAEWLTFPNGLLPWNGGLIVTCAPDILFLKDTDNDGRADERTIWFTGFSTKGSTQLRVSHPTLSIDNWVYVTSGLVGGEVTCPIHPERPPLRFDRTDFRFRPDLSQYETCDGGGQFGQSFDDFGHRFTCYNRVQVQHVVLSSKYLRRNPHLAFSETVQDCPDDLTPEPLKGHGRGAALFPISANVTTADSHAGTFTAACGVLVWRGASLPDRYGGGVFSCDPTGNLVHFDKLTARGATFVAHRATAGIEFLASRDNWFRPVFLSHAPDGALYICDMYRKTIEHPDYLPVEIRKRTDFESGRGMGRIWRVVDNRLTRPDLKRRREQFPALDSDDGWRRDVALRTLLENNERLKEVDPPAGIPINLDLLGEPTRFAISPGIAAAQVSTISYLTQTTLSDDLLITCLRHPLAAVREWALIAAEARLALSNEVGRAVLPLANDVDARVRFQWALTSGEFPDARAIPALASLALRDADDRWLRAAVLSSIAGREEAFLTELILLPPHTSGGAAAFYTEFGRLLGASQPQPRWANLIRQILGAKPRFPAGAALLSGFGDALRNRGASRADGSVLRAALGDDDRELRDFMDLAREIASASNREPKLRVIAIGLLAHADFATVGKSLLDLVSPAQPAAVQSAAIRALAGMQDEAIAKALLAAERFIEYPPAAREEVVSAMLSNKYHLPGLLAAIEAGAVPLGAIDSIRRKQLTDHVDAALRDRARRAFGVGKMTDRGKVYEEYKSLVALPSNPENGRAVFKKQCANCHRLDRDGYPVGPDLFGIRNQPKEAILLHILIPEHEITPGFIAYMAETKDGRVIAGLIAGETPTSVTFKQALGKEETILRADLQRLVSSKLSLMPQELEKTMSKQEIADLIAYLKGESAGQRPGK